jgi:predicted adenine nucleotide alpha hydrolase (AANH) superfamily ATPase
MNIFEGLKSLSGEIKVEEKNLDFQLDVSVKFALTKGYFMQEFCSYGMMWRSKFNGYVIYEESDVETSLTKINDISIGISDFRKMLNSSGLSEIEKSLKFTQQEIKSALYSVLEKNEQVKKMFGENVRIFENLPQKEKDMLELKFVIENYDILLDSSKQKYNREIGLESYVVPTKNDLTTYYFRLESNSI